MLADLIGNTLNYIRLDSISDITINPDSQFNEYYKHDSWEDMPNFNVIITIEGQLKGVFTSSLRRCIAYKEDLLNFLASGSGLDILHRYNTDVGSDETERFIDERAYFYTVGTSLLAVSYNIPESTRWKILEMMIFGLSNKEIAKFYEDGDAWEIVQNFIKELSETIKEYGLSWVYKNKKEVYHGI